MILHIHFFFFFLVSNFIFYFCINLLMSHQISVSKLLISSLLKSLSAFGCLYLINLCYLPLHYLPLPLVLEQLLIFNKFFVSSFALTRCLDDFFSVYIVINQKQFIMKIIIWWHSMQIWKDSHRMILASPNVSQADRLTSDFTALYIVW